MINAYHCGGGVILEKYTGKGANTNLKEIYELENCAMVQTTELITPSSRK
jgi:hypothetical protein